ncbi:GGDEF domain-containing protein [Marinomonas pollencensis]|uniref:diguanylate cyclase n=1 Tax=Marinomonas pollencensis TaxID=491954 RepID=A0A3E0DP67_9GAMM|nr:GGDEF domain-containing protein [Marinomonas pollencensis]REG83268.1 diguanylate cyclase (GGDEF)-like protein [Marinomonas pollencensis]
MLPSKQNWLDKLLNFGISEDSASNLNYKQVVNLALALLCVTDIGMMLVFAVQHAFQVVAFYAAFLALSLFGFYLHSRHYFSLVKLIVPLSTMVQIVVTSLFFFGVDSDFQWLFITVAAYAFTAFRPDEKVLRYSVILLSISLFSVCEVFPVTGVHLSPSQPGVVVVLTFLWTLFTLSVVISVVIARLRKVNDYLRILAERDELTGLANRRKVLTDAVKMYTEALFYHQPCVFAILDLDHFKRINDTFGHDAGDLVLSQISSVMRSCLNEEDAIGRYGGEEFVVIMRNTTLKEALEKMDQLRETVENTYITTEKGIVIPVTVSIGLAAISRHTKRYEDVLSLADTALYQAKKAGRNRVVSQPSIV